MTAPTVLLQLVKDILYVVIEVGVRWTGINNHLMELLTEEATFLEKDRFVKLLFEDDTYSRSRKYFWVLGCLRDFENAMKDTATKWKVFKETYMDPYKESKKEEISDALRVAGHIEVELASIKRIEDGLGDIREQALLLRDGVCQRMCRNSDLFC
jgi:hypothetical protein